VIPAIGKISIKARTQAGLDMKKIAVIILFSLLMVVGVAGTLWGHQIAEAASGVWDSCAEGKVNCHYPGDCHSYIDTNRDSICDRSQPNPQVSSSSTTSDTTDTGNSQDIVDTGTGTESTTAIAGRSSYNFIPILIVCVILYGVTWILSARKIITQVLHRRIWNVVLLVSALIAIIPGAILTINIDLHTRIPLPFNLRYWHVEAGIVLGIVALFHIIWHRRYFVKILKGRAERGTTPVEK
jgi:hypothetical protein